MTLITNWYSLDNKEGANLNVPYTSVDTSSAPNPSVPAAPFALGERCQGNNDSEWMFVRATVTVTQYMAVAINNNGIVVGTLTSALVVSNAYSYGFAQFQTSTCNAGDYFWALLKAAGGIALNISPSATAQGLLYISGTAGTFTSSVTADAMNNLWLVASIGTSASSPGEGAMRGYLMPALNLLVAGATV